MSMKTTYTFNSDSTSTLSALTDFRQELLEQCYRMKARAEQSQVGAMTQKVANRYVGEVRGYAAFADFLMQIEFEAKKKS